ncbi:MAG: AbrB/MazE/SpoVT family DNA-binding domain-containing protein [Chloroflexi bacterium]|nr:AbrB/MazE/SpoVT family DNA-binding domain-containing protein [Chloroflexota bacterium]
MSTEIRRRVTFERVSGTVDTEQPLEEFILVDASGRVQIPREFLDDLKIKERARIHLEDGKVTLTPEEQ